MNKVYKIFLLIVIVVTSIVSCEKYDLTDNSLSEYKSPFKVSELDFTETKLPRDITQFVRNNSFEINRKSNVVIDSAQNFYVNTDKVKYLQAIDSSFHSYTFLVNRLNQQNDIIENLVFSSDSLGGYSANLVKYDFKINNKVSITSKPININSQDYIKSFYLDCVTTVTYESFQDAMCDCEVIKILSTETDCTFTYYSDPDYGGGSGGNTGGSSGGGFGGGAWTGGGGGGTTVGTSPIIPSEQEKCEDGKNALNELTNHPDVKPKLQSLESYLIGNPLNENGIEMRLENDGSYTPISPISTSQDETKFPDIQSNSELQVHVHKDDQFDIFNADDIIEFIRLFGERREAIELQNGLVSNTAGLNTTAIVITPDHMFALRIGDIGKAMSTYTNFKVDNSRPKAFTRDKYTQYEEEIRDKCIDENCTDEELDNRVTEMVRNSIIKKLPFGIDLFEGNKNSEGNYIWTCLD